MRCEFEPTVLRLDRRLQFWGKMFLSRGANAKNKFIASSQYEDCFADISVLLDLIGGHNSSGEKACFHEDDWNESHNSPLSLSLAQLLVQHGADVNESVVDNGSHKLQLLAYWPNLIVAAYTQAEADARSRMAWCEQLLTRHGADANWPCNSVAKSTFVTGRFRTRQHGYGTTWHWSNFYCATGKTQTNKKYHIGGKAPGVKTKRVLCKVLNDVVSLTPHYLVTTNTNHRCPWQQNRTTKRWYNCWNLTVQTHRRKWIWRGTN